MKSKVLFFILIWIVGLLILNNVGCNAKDEHIGIYEAVDTSEESSQEKIYIELKENSKGAWKRQGEEVPFSWNVKNDQLRINTKDGGTMIGEFKRKGLIMIFPDEIEIEFKKLP